MAHARLATHLPAHIEIEQTVGAALLLSGGVHLAVGFDHAEIAFGTLSLGAGALQLTLGAVVWRRRSTVAAAAAAVLALMLVQLYALSVTIGLPPQIAHLHIAGTHSVWGMTLSLPQPVDVPGAVAVCAELVTVAGAMIRNQRTA